MAIKLILSVAMNPVVQLVKEMFFADGVVLIDPDYVKERKGKSLIRTVVNQLILTNYNVLD